MKISEVLNNITRYTSDAVIITTMPGDSGQWPVIQFANDAFAALTGYRPEEVRGRSIDSLFLSDDADALQKRLRQTWAQAGRLDVETQITSRTGRHYWIEFTGTTICNKDEEPTYLVITARDISERKSMQAATEQQSMAFLEGETRMRAIMNSIADGVITVDEGGLITSMSSVAERLFGAQVTEMEGQPLYVLFSDESKAELEALLAAKMYAAHDEGRFCTHELLAKHQNGDNFDVRITCSIVRVGAQKTMVVAARDVSQEKEALDALKIARDAAERTSKAKTEFLANMSHELRTPMNGILGLAELLREAPLSEEHREYLNALDGSAESLLTILNDILDFSKIEAGEMQLAQTPFSFRKVLMHVGDLLRPIASKKGIVLGIDVPDNLPSGLIGDEHRLQQVLINLAGNAIKFTERGSVKISADIEVLADAQAALWVRVQDTGIGIPEEHISKLFDKFSQVDGANTRKFGGTGLGLAISKQLIGMMGGTIDVQSTEGKGSCFSFKVVLPIARIEEDKRKQMAKMPTLRTSQLSIMMVEDHAVNQMLLSRVLEKAGFRDIVIAKNGEEAVKRWEQQNFDLILMDCQMPVMDGYDATKFIREAEEKNGRTRTSIVALTANVLARDKEACFKAGMDAYLSKPIRIDNLHQTIMDLLMPEILQLQAAYDSAKEKGVEMCDIKIPDASQKTMHPVLNTATLPLRKQANEQAVVVEKMGNTSSRAILHLFLINADIILKNLDKNIVSSDKALWQQGIDALLEGAQGTQCEKLQHLCEKASTATTIANKKKHLVHLRKAITEMQTTYEINL